MGNWMPSARKKANCIAMVVPQPVRRMGSVVSHVLRFEPRGGGKKWWILTAGGFAFWFFSSCRVSPFSLWPWMLFGERTLAVSIFAMSTLGTLNKSHSWKEEGGNSLDTDVLDVEYRGAAMLGFSGIEIVADGKRLFGRCSLEDYWFVSIIVSKAPRISSFRRWEHLLRRKRKK